MAKKYEGHINRERNLLDFIDKQRNVKKAKNFALPVEITNYIIKCVMEKQQPEGQKKKNRG